MALTSIFGCVRFPRYASSGTPGYGNMLIDAAAEKAGYVIQIPRTGTISKIGFPLGTVTVNAASRLYAGLYTVSAGDPTATNYGGSADYVGSAAPVTGWTWYTLATGASATIDDVASLVIGYNVFTASDVINARLISTAWSNSVPVTNIYGDAYIGTPAWSRQDAYALPIALEYSDGVIEQVAGCYPLSAYTTLTWNNTSNPNYLALRFRLSVPALLYGVDVSFNLGDDMNVKFFGSDGFTVPAGGSILVPNANKTVSGSMRNFSLKFPTAPTLAANTWYRVACLPNSATSSTITYFDVTDDGANPAMNAMDGGVDFHYSTANGTPTAEASWTQTLTRRMCMSLLLKQFDNGAGGGGSSMIVHPGMGGGMRG